MPTVNHLDDVINIWEDRNYVLNLRQNLFKGNALQTCYASFSVYKNITVFWDEDFDERILRFIDNLDFSFHHEMYAVLFVHEHEGGLEIVLSYPISPDFENYLSESVGVEGDLWSTALIKIYE